MSDTVLQQHYSD